LVRIQHLLLSITLAFSSLLQYILLVGNFVCAALSI